METVVFRSAALKSLRRMDNTGRPRISAALARLAQNDLGEVIPLKGRPGFRMRAGDYRVIFLDDGKVIDVLDLGHRREIYR